MRFTGEIVMNRQSPSDPKMGDEPARVLFIPQAKEATTSERTPMLLRTLKERHDVIGLSAPWDRILYDPSRAKWLRALLYPVDKAVLGIRGILLARRRGAGIVFCETAHHALAGLFVAKILGIRCVWDSHGNGVLFYRSLGKGPLSIRMITWLERFLGQRVDVLVTVSPIDAEAYKGLGLSPSKIRVLPLCVRLSDIDLAVGTPTPPEDGSETPILLFFGSFRYEPNLEALEFVNDVLAPSLERNGVRCEIQIAGRDIPPMAFHPLVRPIGFVPDIYGCIRSATLCIVPVRRGVGVLTKVLDSMAVGTPLVLTRFAADGIPDLRPGVHAYVAGSDEDFLRAIERALTNDGERRAMADAARRLVERRFDWDSYLPQLEAIIDGSSAVPEGAGA
ncbi:MAG: glycosyltransferase family 4 protein [Methanobacteriota archaeon]|nr:MAG: glycosyltransferase family 4 protein [Euryarchaeota archaeon]